MPVFRGDFNRKEDWAECDGVRYTANSPGGDNIYPLCRALLSAGHEDGVLKLYDERGMHCMTLSSIRWAATKIVNGIHLGTYTEAEAAPEEVAVISPGVYKSLTMVAKGQWEQLHHLAKAGLVRNEYVVVDGNAVLTDEGQEAMATFEANPPKIKVKKIKEPKEPKERKKRVFTEEQRAAISVRLTKARAKNPRNTANNAPTVFKCGNRWITIKQREAIDILANHPRKISTIHGKTVNKLVEFGFVNNTGSRPMLVNAGYDAAKTLGLLSVKAAA